MDDSNIRQRMEEVVELVRGDIASIRTGRASATLVQDISVTTYGGSAKLRIVELATITSPDPHAIIVSPWDKSTIFDIKRALEEADIGVNPVVDNNVIRINLPPLTSEDRQQFVKLLHQKLENGRIIVRRIRQEAMETIDRAFENKDFGEDEKFRREEQIQKLTDQHVEKIEELGKKKEEELLQI